MSSFSSIPILNLSLAKNQQTKPNFLEDLRHALLQVGFLYISHTGIDDKLVEKVKHLGTEFFNLPEEEKLKMEMKNSPHFLGYSQLGNEITKFAVDWREQIDLGTELPAPSPEEPRYRNLQGPNQWPSESSLPGFRDTFIEYMKQMADMSLFFTSLIAEAIGLPSDAFDKYFDGVNGDKQQHKLKIVKYPDMGQLKDGTGQGVGPHKDSMLTSYLLQVTKHRGLQVQNTDGEWIDCPPIDGTFVVAIGQGLEAMTSGVCVSTTHRVLSPEAGSGPRLSIPFFQGVSYDARLEEMNVPEQVLKLKPQISDKFTGKDAVEMTFKKERYKHLGEGTLMNRVKSHPDVSEKWYPDLLAKIREEQRLEAEKQNNHDSVPNSQTIGVR